MAGIDQVLTKADARAVRRTLTGPFVWVDDKRGEDVVHDPHVGEALSHLDSIVSPPCKVAAVTVRAVLVDHLGSTIKEGLRWPAAIVG